MGSLKRKIRSLKDGHSTLADVPELVAHAREKKNLPPIPQNLTRRIVHGWEVFLSSFDHERPPSTGTAPASSGRTGARATKPTGTCSGGSLTPFR